MFIDWASSLFIQLAPAIKSRVSKVRCHRVVNAKRDKLLEFLGKCLFTVFLYIQKH